MYLAMPQDRAPEKNVFARCRSGVFSCILFVGFLGFTGCQGNDLGEETTFKAPGDEDHDCGAPTFDPAVVAGLHVWRDCDTDRWHLLATAGGGNEHFVGVIESDLGFDEVTPARLEASDRVDSSGSGRIEFSLYVSDRWRDEIEFSFPDGANVVLTVDEPSDVAIFLGEARDREASPAVLSGMTQRAVTVECGQPSVDSVTTAAAVIWRNCEDGQWHVEFTGGADRATYNGSIVGDRPFDSVDLVSIEPHDRIDRSEVDVVSIELSVTNPWRDEIDFTIDDNARASLELSEPGTTQFLVGPALEEYEASVIVTAGEDGGSGGGGGDEIVCADTVDYEALGYLPVTNFGADPTGRRISTAAIQSAIDEAYSRGMVAFFPTGTYLVDDTIEMRQNDDGPNREGHILVGSYCGERPVIRLRDRSAGFDVCGGYPDDMTNCRPDTTPDYSTPSPCDFRERTNLKSVILFWRENDDCTAAEQNPDASEGGRDWNNVIRNIDIVLGDNPGAVGIRHSGAEGSATQEVRVDARGGFAGIYSLNNSGGYNYDIEVIGGRHGIYATRMRGGPPLVVGLRLSGQTEEPLVIEQYTPTNIVGFEIEHETGPVISVRRGGHSCSGHLAMIDGSIELTAATSPVIRNTERSIYLQNVYVRGATDIVFSSTASARLQATNPEVWSLVDEYSYGGNYEASFGEPGALVDGHRTDQTYYDGGLTSALDLRAAPAGHLPSEDLLSRHLHRRGLCHVEDANLLFVTDFGATPDGGGDDTAAIQAAIDRAQAEGTNGVFVPFGEYQISGTITLRENTMLCGASRTSSILNAAAWTPTSEQPILRTVDSASATTSVAELMLGMGDVPQYAVRWMAGRDSVVRDLYYERMHWRSDENRRRAIITGNGGGRWYGLLQRGGYHEPVGPDARLLLIQGTNEPLTFYSLHCQHLVSSGNPQCEMRNAANVTVYSLKAEMTSHPDQIEDISAEDMNITFAINNSRNFSIYGVEGMLQTAPGRGLFEITNSENITLVHVGRRDVWSKWPRNQWNYVVEDYYGRISRVDATNFLRFFRRH